MAFIPPFVTPKDRPRWWV